MAAVKLDFEQRQEAERILANLEESDIATFVYEHIALKASLLEMIKMVFRHCAILPDDDIHRMKAARTLIEPKGECCR